MKEPIDHVAESTFPPAFGCFVRVLHFRIRISVELRHEEGGGDRESVITEDWESSTERGFFFMKYRRAVKNIAEIG